MTDSTKIAFLLGGSSDSKAAGRSEKPAALPSSPIRAVSSIGIGWSSNRRPTWFAQQAGFSPTGKYSARYQRESRAFDWTGPNFQNGDSKAACMGNSAALPCPPYVPLADGSVRVSNR